MATEIRVDLTEVGNYVAALRMVLCDLAAVIHQIDPDGIQNRLRGVRLLVQDLELGRAELGHPHGMAAQQLRLQMLEQCADRDALWGAPQEG